MQVTTRSRSPHNRKQSPETRRDELKNGITELSTMLDTEQKAYDQIKRDKDEILTWLEYVDMKKRKTLNGILFGNKFLNCL